MLPRENRLILGNDFDLVYKYGRFFSSGIISLRVAKNKLNSSRIGFSIGVKFSPKAVLRNKVRRQLREIAKKELIELREGFDIVVMLKKEKNFPKWQILVDDFKKALQQGNLINK